MLIRFFWLLNPFSLLRGLCDPLLLPIKNKITNMETLFSQNCLTIPVRVHFVFSNAITLYRCLYPPPKCRGIIRRFSKKDDLIKQERSLFCLLFELLGFSQELNSLAFTEIAELNGGCPKRAVPLFSEVSQNK